MRKKVTNGNRPLYVEQLQNGRYAIINEQGKRMYGETYADERDAIGIAVDSVLRTRVSFSRMQSTDQKLRDALQIAGILA